MNDALTDHLRRMQDSAQALRDGRAGYLNDEQSNLVRMICEHTQAVPGKIARLEKVMGNGSTPEVRNELICDLNNLLTPIVHCAELIGGGEVGRVTRKQREATQTILKAVVMIRSWTNAKFDGIAHI
jgi:hypothetical protein